MKKLFTATVNIVFFIIIVVVALAVSTISLTKKVNDYKKEHSETINAIVEKQQVPIISFTQGFVKELPIKTGKKIKKNDVLATLDNPLLKSKAQALNQYKDNVSAQTEARVAEEELKNLTVLSPVNGIVGDIFVIQGAPIESFAKIATLYSNENARVIVKLTEQQYLDFQKMNTFESYNKRLNQTFRLKIDSLRPSEEISKSSEGLIGVYLTFVNEDDVASLLNNETLEIRLTPKTQSVIKPIDYFVDFWNKILPPTNNE